MKLAVLTGRVFGRITVGERAPNVGRNTMWYCTCDCGATKPVAAKHLLDGKIVSCGCFNAELTVKRLTKHGDSQSRDRSPEYRSWHHLKSRCLNPNVPDYARYGGRGITICDEWRDSYSAFLRDMGRRPSARHSIDRIDNNKGYEPGNCRWATAVEQSRNRRCIVMSLDKARLVRQMAIAGIRRRDIQSYFGISKSAIGLILRGETWREERV